jgi:hypothetical protein
MCYILVYTLNIVLKISQHKKSKILSKSQHKKSKILSNQFHIKYNNRTKHVLYIGIYPQYCIENISTQKKQDPIQSKFLYSFSDLTHTLTSMFSPSKLYSKLVFM